MRIGNILKRSATPAPQAIESVRFGAFVFHLARGELTRDGDAVLHFRYAPDWLTNGFRARFRFGASPGLSEGPHAALLLLADARIDSSSRLAGEPSSGAGLSRRSRTVF